VIVVLLYPLSACAVLDTIWSNTSLLRQKVICGVIPLEECPKPMIHDELKVANKTMMK